MMMQPANIVCMKWGTRYTSADVNNLYAMVSRNITRPLRFVCYTDNREDLHHKIEAFDLPPFRAAHLQTMGAYQKKTLCRADLEPFETGERFLYLDLDVVITSNLDTMIDYLPNEDFVISYNWTRGKGTIGNSSVTMFRKGPLQYVVDDLEANFLAIQNRFRTASQEFLSHKIIEKYGKLNFWPDQWCQSFPYHSMPPRALRWLRAPIRPPQETKVLVFHGAVKPADAIRGHFPGNHSLWKRWYKRLKPTPWIREYYEDVAL